LPRTASMLIPRYLNHSTRYIPDNVRNKHTITHAPYAAAVPYWKDDNMPPGAAMSNYSSCRRDACRITEYYWPTQLTDHMHLLHDNLGTLMLLHITLPECYIFQSARHCPCLEAHIQQLGRYMI
jgi:hypothetical protein